MKEQDEESDGVPPRPKAKAKAKVKGKAMPVLVAQCVASLMLVAAEGWRSPCVAPMKDDSGLQWLQLSTSSQPEVQDLWQLWPCGRLVHPGTEVSEFDHREDPIESTDRSKER